MENLQEYILETGNNDYKRLKLLSHLYNPGALAFMQKQGLKTGMSVLEIGCGIGYMAVELAKIVGPEGKVLATDNSDAQLELAKLTAKQANVSNIAFLNLDLVTDLSMYQNQFDFTYGRWVIEFTKEAAKKVLEEWFYTLKKGGTLVYESVDLNDDSGMFTYPDLTMSNLYAKLGKHMFTENNMPLDFIKRAYCLLKELGAHAVDMATNQAILKTPEEKSVMRLGLLAAEIFMKNKMFTEIEFTKLIQAYEALEASDNIVGFYRNYLVTAKR